MQAHRHKKEHIGVNTYPVFTAPNPDQENERFDDDHFQGFIHHPRRFPIEYRRIHFWEKPDQNLEEESDIGLTISSAKYVKPGTCIEITIPTRGEIQQFICRIILVREMEEGGYELGLWLLNKSDGPRMRIVEQICHIELYLNDKKHLDGPFLSRERLTSEWITRFAANFPSI